MNNFIRKIAEIEDQPARFSLSGNPNYVTFGSIEGEDENSTIINIIDPNLFAQRTFNTTFEDLDEDKYPIHENSGLVVVENENNRYFFNGAVKPNPTDDEIFLIEKTAAGTARNIRDCILKKTYISSNFEITLTDSTIPNKDGIFEKGGALKIRDKNAASGIRFRYSTYYQDNSFIFPKNNSKQIEKNEKKNKYLTVNHYADELIFIDGYPESDSTKWKEMNEKIMEATKFTITERGGERVSPYTFYGTRDPKKLNNNVFMIDYDKCITAENIRTCLLKNAYIKGNFDILILPSLKSDGAIAPESILEFVPKGVGERYMFEFKANNKDCTLFAPLEFTMDCIDLLDSIRGRKPNCELQLEIYRNDPHRTDKTGLGKPITTLSKTYIDRPVWFDLNNIFNTEKPYSDSFLTAEGWCDAGTLNEICFLAKRNDGENTLPFYLSDKLHIVTGYMRSLKVNDLENEDESYAFDPSKPNSILPLTLQPVMTHIKGQSQYFNFILHDTAFDERTNNFPEFDIYYRMYTQSGNEIGQEVAHKTSFYKPTCVNSIKLDLDYLLNDANNTKIGIIKAYLRCNGKVISRPLTFRILPQHLHKVHDFAFLNSLGGWSSFNFEGNLLTEFKTKANTYTQTQTPGFNASSRLESVYTKEIEEQFTLETSPIDAHTSEWLKELSASPAVYEMRTRRHIVIDDLSVKYSTKDDLFTGQMKYHYSNQIY